MKLIDLVKNFFLRKEEKDVVPEEYCPNCWGRQEYGNQLYNAVQHHKIDLNNIHEKKGWIEAYADEHFNGIRLIDKDGQLLCPHCKISYQPS